MPTKLHRTCPKCGKKIFGTSPKEVLGKYRGHMGGHGKREKKERLEKEEVRRQFHLKSGIDLDLPKEREPESCNQPDCGEYVKPASWSVNWAVSQLQDPNSKVLGELKKKNKLLKDLVMRLLMEIEDE